MADMQKNKHKSRIRQRKSRREIGSRAYKNYSEDMFKLACEAIVSKQISSRDAERQFGIPRRTLVNKIKKLHTKSVGRPTFLTSEEEEKIVRVLQASSDFGSPLTKLDLKLLVYEYLRKNSRESLFKNKIPGDAWVQGFLSRHVDDLSVRITQNISKGRAEKGPQEIASYFENLSFTLKDIPATNIINLDETNLSDDPGSSKCIFRRGVRYPERIANSTKGNISLMFTAIASGQCLPLYVVYKAKNLYSEWVTGGPPGTRYNCTKSGWFDSAMFEDYFEKIIIPWAQETLGTKVVICDNLSSHLSVKVVDMCEQYNIKFIFIPPRSTHLTQPLDVAFFAPLKKAWRQILYQYKLKNPNQSTINKKHFPKLLNELTQAIRLNEDKNIKSGFKASGIFPLNPQEVLKKIPEMQEEILSYGVDQALIDYLKETRAPKPMEVKRNKKINCEPGKSVTVNDLNIICCKKDTLKDNTKKKINQNNLSEIQSQNKNESALYFDDRTGLFTNTNNDTKENQDSKIDNYCFDGKSQKTLQEKKGMSGKKYSQQNNLPTSKTYQQSTLILNTPETLTKYCIDVINFVLYNSVNKVTYTNDFQLSKCSTSGNSYPLISKNNDKFPNHILQQEAETSGNSTKKTAPKITVLSNVIIKTATQTPDVRFLSEISKAENMPFISKCSRDLPKCLQEMASKTEKKIKKEKINRKRTKINRKNKQQQNNSQEEKRTQEHVSMKRKKKRSICNSSSTSVDSIIEIDDTDNSDYETLQSYYISECLKDQEEKENYETTAISFGLTDIEYFVEEQSELKEGDWILAQFTTKKSIKHFVGKVLSIIDKKPTIKFLRKVKQSKFDKGTIFTYPNVDDTCTLQFLEDVISVLPEPTISRRGHIIFNVDFSNLNIQ